MSYIYGKRFVGRMTPLVLELRNELYEDPYNLIDWNKARNQCAKVCWRDYLLALKLIQLAHLFWTARSQGIFILMIGYN
jgi:hypothetical protein